MSTLVPDDEDVAFAKFDRIFTSDDGREVRVYFHNSQTYQQAAAMRRDVIVSVRIAVTCSDVDHGKPEEYTFGTKSFVAPGGTAVVYAGCPRENYNLALTSKETHTDGLTTTEHKEGLYGDTYSYRNDDPYVMGSATVAVTCGKPLPS